MKSGTFEAYNQGLRNAREGKLTEAQALLRQAIKADPNHIEAHNVLGKVCLHLGDLRTATSHWEHVLSIDTTHPTARECLKTLRRSNLLWTMRVFSRGMGILALATLVLFAAWRYELPGRVSDLVSAAIQLPGQLRAQPAIQTPVLASVHRPAESDVEVASPVNQTPEIAQTPGTHTGVSPEVETVPPSSLEPEAIAAEPAAEPATTSPTSEIHSREQLRVTYDKALAQFRAGEVDQARSGFQAILNSGMTSSLLDNAQYWLAECDASQGRYAEARAGFARVELLPDGNKAHDARTRLRKIERLMASN